jgi:phosphomannomutase
MDATVGIASATDSPRSLFAGDGVRGVYLNDISRPFASRLAVAFAGLLWRATPLRGRLQDYDLKPDAGSVPRRVPQVVLGRDGRASSPDIAAGAAAGLRRMGCRVIDLGHVARPAIDFGVYHLRADGAVYVTGAGCPPSWTGLDFVAADGVAWSGGRSLDRIEKCCSEPVSRPTRQGGELEGRDIETPHRAMLGPHLHGLRHVRVGISSSCEATAARAAACFRDLSGSVDVLTALRIDDEDSPAQRRRLRDVIRERDLQFLAAVDDDGRGLHLIDEQGRAMLSSSWLVRLAEQRLRSSDAAAVIVPMDLPALTKGRLSALGARVISVGGSHEELAAALIAENAALAADGQGRIWFNDRYPVCDALVTLAHLMRLASTAGGTPSHWAA